MPPFWAVLKDARRGARRRAARWRGGAMRPLDEHVFWPSPCCRSRTVPGAGAATKVVGRGVDMAAARRL